MSDIEETAKAVTETAKFGTTSIEAVTKMGSFLARVFGMPIENAVGIIGDKVEYTRWERQNRLIDKVIEEQTKRGLKQFRAVPPKYAISIIFNASIEEEDELQDLWCKLLTNCSDPTFNEEIRYAFIDIIKNLTALDAKILKYVYDTSIEINKQNQTTRFVAYPIDFYEIGENARASLIDTELSLNNLQRVQCIWDNDIRDFTKSCSFRANETETMRPIYCRSELNYDRLDRYNLKLRDYKEDYNKEIKALMKENRNPKIKHSRYKITPLGYAFIKACIK